MIRDLFLNNVSGLGLGVYLEKAPPIHSARERGEWIEVAGMDGEAWRGDGALEGFDVECGLYVTEAADIDAVLAWLRGATALRWGDYAWEYHVSGCEIDGGLEDWEEAIGYGWECRVKWRAEPWRYLVPAAQEITLSNPQTLVNPGTGWAAPRITVTGSGDITLAVGRWTVELTDVAEGVVLDCGARMAYNLEMTAMATEQVRLLSTDAGRWPRLLPGNNAIGWTGNAAVTILPRWRNL